MYNANVKNVDIFLLRMCERMQKHNTNAKMSIMSVQELSNNITDEIKHKTAHTRTSIALWTTESWARC